MKKRLAHYILSFASLFFIILTASSEASAEPFETIISNGSPQNRVDIAILGDGYTSAQMAQYRIDVQQFILGVFAQEPYREYQRYYNVHRVDVISNQSGADHPERIPPVFVDTAFDAAYNCASIQRLICVNTSKVNQVISASLPANHYDVILILVNDPEYGGSGGSVAVASTNASAIELILHEVGHSFGLLADEYAGGGPSCNPNVEPAAANATRQTERALIKWNAWIAPATPIPTTTMTNGIPGLYVGSQYCETGLYRPTYNNKMRSLGLPFEQINTEQHVKRIYNFVSPIDSSSPSGTNVTMTTAQSRTFAVTTPQPFTHTVNINWTVDGQQTATGSTFLLVGSNLSVGQHTLQAVAVDPTPFVRNDPLQALRQTRTWTIDVQAARRATPFDFDGDGKTDIGIFRPSNGQWWYQRSLDSQVQALQFGAGTDRIAPVDFTGDGKTDVAFFRPSTGEWFVLRSDDGSYYAFPFGATGDVPAPADYDGDGKADHAVFRPSNSTWYILRSIDGVVTFKTFGITGDVPVTADYDGDGKADVGIFRPSLGEWWIDRTTAGLVALQFGASADKPVQGDYTGDGKSDIAFWRPSNGFWFIIRSEDLSFYAYPFGTTGDVPVSGDYDGDGRTDAAIFRPTNSTWFAARSSGGVTILQFGSGGDQAIPSAFVP